MRFACRLTAVTVQQGKVRVAPAEVPVAPVEVQVQVEEQVPALVRPPAVAEQSTVVRLVGLQCFPN
jgi:hypothetical protein